jgi:uncharacterized membrane protein YidH (DUF202 family)
MSALRQDARDPGLQPERTALAWRRTATGLLLNAVLALRVGWVEESAGLVATSLALILAAACVFVVGSSRGSQLAAHGGSAAPLRSGSVLGITAVTLVAALTGLWSVVVTF